MIYYFLHEYEGREDGNPDYIMTVKEVGASMYRGASSTKSGSGPCLLSYGVPIIQLAGAETVESKLIAYHSLLRT